MTGRTDIIIVGGGIAGASLAAEIASKAGTVLIEMESRPGYHSTGRSAAFWSELYGGPLVQPLTTASGPFLADPPPEFSERSFLKQRGAIHLACREGEAALTSLAGQFAGSGVALMALGRNDLETRIPGLKPGRDKGLWEPSCADIDVAGLHAAYLAKARQQGARIVTDAEFLGAERRHGRWLVRTRAGEFDAAMLVNAAGAWADNVAARAGERPLGIRPFRRTMIQLRLDRPVPDSLPLVLDALGRFYFKPEAGGKLWLSPHDETPCAPGDCAAEDMDVALAVTRLESTVDWRVERVEHRWAGLRSFAPDRLPVFGFAPGGHGFFWCAGQGGFGIQTAPAAAKLAAALLLEENPDPIAAGIDPAPYLAGRFGN